MTIGIPKALLYYKYHAFATAFFEALGARVIVSPDTNRQILDTGALVCTDEACLPVKVMHGHTAWLQGRCDRLLVPRFMRMVKGKSICPMFCGLPDMLRGALPQLPPLIDAPVWSITDPERWALMAGRGIAGKSAILRAAQEGLFAQRVLPLYPETGSEQYRVALIGHAYVLGDRFVNMGLLKKLARLSISVVTEERVGEDDITRAAARLFKSPFWYFARRYYGAAAHLAASGQVDGVLYVSAFSCGVDSVTAELVAGAAEGLPFMILKIDEHTGEAGIDTRLEAFADMLEGRRHGHHVPADGQHYAGRQVVL